jgi:hypothetical protein
MSSDVVVLYMDKFNVSIHETISGKSDGKRETMLSIGMQVNIKEMSLTT